MKTLKDYISEKLIFEDSSISATDMEVMICYAHNAQRGFFNTNIANLKYCTNGSPTKEERKIPNKYKNNQEIYDSIVKDLYNLGKLRKLDTKEVSMTSVWKKLGRIDTGEVPIDNTPKTDIICDDEKIKISVKKGNGNPAQLCSAKLPEAKATLMYAKDKLKEDDEIELLNTILSAENWKSFTKLSKSITDKAEPMSIQAEPCIRR